jgi:ABC-type multidrug transport system fused ATPase/permease subunit
VIRGSRGRKRFFLLLLTWQFWGGGLLDVWIKEKFLTVDVADYSTEKNCIFGRQNTQQVKGKRKKSFAFF